MITMILSASAAAGVLCATHWGLDWSTGWSIVCAIVAFFAVQAVVGLKVRKLIMADMMNVQRIVLDGQKKLQQKVQRWQMRPPGSIQAAQREIMADTRVFVKEALAATEALSRYRLWVPMIERQKATAKLQLCWMIKDFDKVDELAPKAIALDPTVTAMKMARMQMKDAPLDDIRKVYEKGARRCKYNQNVLIAACWSWILLKRGDADGAFKALTEALKKSDNETLKRNHEHLMNNRPTHFSNSGLGDQWYSLFLEEPKVRMQRQRPAFR